MTSSVVRPSLLTDLSASYAGGNLSELATAYRLVLARSKPVAAPRTGLTNRGCQNARQAERPLEAALPSQPGLPAIPPICDQTAENIAAAGRVIRDSATSKAEARVTVCVDALSATFAPDMTAQEAADWIGGQWRPTPYGRYGYRQSLRRGALEILHDGQASMGPHLIAKGQGCCQLQAEGRVDSGWNAFLAEALTAGVRVTRIDIAFDDRDGLLNMRTIRQAVQEGCLVTCYRQIDGKEGLVGSKEDTVHFGLAESESSVKIYDKQAEQIDKGNSDPGPWIRVEITSRGRRAQAMAEQLAHETDLSSVAGHLLSVLDFKQVGKSKQKTRWQTASWWTAFLGNAEKARLTLSPRNTPDIEAKRQWLRRSCARALAIVEECYPGETACLLAIGQAALTARERRLLAQHHRDMEEEAYDRVEARPPASNSFHISPWPRQRLAAETFLAHAA